jgi:predicted amino acid racemase
VARLLIHIDRVVQNIEKIGSFMQEHGKQWSLVVKVLGNHREVLSRVLLHPAVRDTHSIAVSHWKSLKTVKEIDPTLVTMFIKPPSIRNVKQIVRYADISFNTSLRTIRALSEEAVRQGRTHRVIVMIEMGELREGIKREGLIPFYKSIFKLPNLEVEGIGTNLGCMYGIQPTYDKLIQLVLYQQLLEAKFKKALPLVSGASSITLPLLEKGKIPAGVNHFRIGEAAFLGTSPLTNRQFHNLHTNAFTFEAAIVELYRKDSQPDGELTDAGVGHAPDPGKLDEGDSFRAVMDFGILDVDAEYLVPVDDSVKFIGNSSDLTVYDLGENPNRYKTGDNLKFRLQYLAVAKLMYSAFVDKEIVGG